MAAAVAEAGAGAAEVVAAGAATAAGVAVLATDAAVTVAVAGAAFFFFLVEVRWRDFATDGAGALAAGAGWLTVAVEGWETAAGGITGAGAVTAAGAGSVAQLAGRTESIPTARLKLRTGRRMSQSPQEASGLNYITKVPAKNPSRALG